MKNFMRTISMLMIMAAGIFAVSCTDLSTDPASEITQANFNPKKKDIPNLLSPVYSPMRSFSTCCYPYIGSQEESADILIKPLRPGGTWDGPYLPWHRHNWAPNHNYVGNFKRTGIWEVFFDGVNAANRLIDQINEETIKLEDPLKTELLAELKVARAYWYSLLLDNYGNVPIVTDFDIKEAPKQNTRKEVYNFVVDQLKENIPNLSEKSDLSMYGRFNRWAGKMVLAEVYLNAGVYRGDVRDVNAGKNGEWQKVIDVTNDIINSGRYELASDYKASFTRDNRSSPEIILGIPHDANQVWGNTFHMMTLPAEARQAFGMKASPWNGGAAQPQFAGSYDEDDKRLEDTWIRGTLRGPSGDSLTGFVRNIPSIEDTKTKHGWRLGKYEIYEGIRMSSDVDIPFYRYAETLMMKAEALLRLGNAGQAAEIVTRVRQRAFEDPSEARVTGSELKQPSVINWGFWKDGEIVEPGDGPPIKYGRFMDELGWEFAMEGHRRQDMIRFGAFTTKSWLNHRESEPFKRLFPIPVVSLDTNPNVEQNPGY